MGDFDFTYIVYMLFNEQTDSWVEYRVPDDEKYQVTIQEQDDCGKPIGDPMKMDREPAREQWSKHVRAGYLLNSKDRTHSKDHSEIWSNSSSKFHHRNCPGGGYSREYEMIKEDLYLSYGELKKSHSATKKYKYKIFELCN